MGNAINQEVPEYLKHYITELKVKVIPNASSIVNVMNQKGASAIRFP